MIDIEKLKLDTWEEIKDYEDISDVNDFINKQTLKIADDSLQIRNDKLKKGAFFIGTLAECQDNDKEVKATNKQLKELGW